MRSLPAAIVALVIAISVIRLTAQAPPEWEVRFRQIPEAGNIGEYLRTLSARPHHLGSAYGKQNAEWIRARFADWGWDARIESYDVLFPTPTERLVELVAPTRFKALLEEPAVPGDPTSGQKDEQLPTFNAYSIDGDVTAPLVYVNYGRPVDYEELERRDISVKGAIVIARYGGSWRGIKPKVAAEHGAVGCLIYSDPRDDGYFVEGAFPGGPMRNKDGVQRGSVMDMPTYPGDPLTPGVGATAGAVRLALKRCDDAHEDPGPPDFVRRCATAARSARRPGCPHRLARRAADHLPRGARSCTRAVEAGVRLEPEARQQRHRADPGVDVSGRMDRPRQPSRRVGQRRHGSGQRDGRRARRGASARRAR